MKYAQRFKAPESYYTTIVSVKCDLCGRVAPGDAWDENSGTICEVEVRYRKGFSSYDGGSGDEYEFDICPDCFTDKIVPWIESHGHGKVSKKMWDW